VGVGVGVSWITVYVECTRFSAMRLGLSARS